MRIELKRYKVIKSTNDIAIKLINKNISKPTLIVAEKQTAGKGTMGKAWISTKGNLFFSIFFKLHQKKLNFKHFAILNALLLKSLVSEYISKKIQIKWPNDLLYKKKKFCGILQENMNFNHFRYLIVGIGINTNITPRNKSFKSICLKNIIGKKIDNKKILMIIKKKYEVFLVDIERLSFEDLKKKYR